MGAIQDKQERTALSVHVHPDVGVAYCKVDLVYIRAKATRTSLAPALLASLTTALSDVEAMQPYLVPGSMSVFS